MKISKQTGIIAAALALALGSGSALAQRPLGIDVSSYQGSGVNWSGVTFGWAKATEGTYDDDADFAINENNAKSHGTYIGAYHFARPDLDSAGSEASFFWAQAGGYIKNDGKTAQPALDFETFNGSVGGSYSQWANSWDDDIINDAAGNGVKVRTVLYCSTCQACNFDSSVGQTIPWIANPSGESAQTGSPWGNTSCPSCGAGIWGSGAWDVWQYGGSSIDLDVFNGVLSDLQSTLVVGTSDGGGKTNFATCVGPIVANTDGRLEIFGVGSNSDIWHIYQTAANSSWTSWIDMANGNSIPSPTVNRQQNGLLNAFVECGSGNVFHNFQVSGGGGAWNGWGSQGGPSVTNLVALTNLNGKMEVFGIGNNQDVWHEYQTAVNGSWSSWFDLSGEHIKGGMVGIGNLDGRLEVFGQGTSNGHVWHNYQTTAGGGWNGWADMGSSSSGLNPRLAIARNANGMLEIFGVDSGGNVWHNYQIPGTGGAWNGFIGFGGQSGIKPGFIVGCNHDGRLEMFGVGSNGNTYHVWQDQPGSRWHSWSNLGGNSDPNLMIGNNANGELQLFAIGGGNSVYTIYQNSPGGSWGNWFGMGGTGMKFFYGQP